MNEQEVYPAKDYSGDISPQTAHRWWQAQEAYLIDVRTAAECAWVGAIPQVPNIEWKSWPSMQNNAQFSAQLQSAVPPAAKVLFLCRSGVRSIAAAQAAQLLGYQAFNILEGFEGDLDGAGHRGNRGGWRFHGLPWQQG